LFAEQTEKKSKLRRSGGLENVPKRKKCASGTFLVKDWYLREQMPDREETQSVSTMMRYKVRCTLYAEVILPRRGKQLFAQTFQKKSHRFCCCHSSSPKTAVSPCFWG